MIYTYLLRSFKDGKWYTGASADLRKRPVAGRTPRATAGSKRGFSTIELMIALSILTLAMSAVVIVSFGTQSFLIHSQTGAEAMTEAQGLLEREQAEGRKDFNLVNSTASTTNGIYEEAVYVRMVDDASHTYLTKEVTALISWRNERNATSSLELTTLISNFDTPVGNNTCDSTLSGNWAVPVVENTSTDFASLVGDAGGMYTLSDVDAYRGRLYVTASTVSAPTKPTFFVFDISNPATPSLLGKIDNEGTTGTVSAGLSSVRVAEDPGSSPVKTYAYATNAYSANYSACNPVTTRNCGQLSLIDVTTPTLSGWNPAMTNLMIASSTTPFVKGSQTYGTSVYYKNGYLLLGLASTGAGNGPEFHMLDMHNPSLQYGGTHLLYPVGSYAVGNDINAIAMRGTYAYVVTPNTNELQILNLSNPNTPTLAGNYNAPTGAGNGKSMYLLGNTLYLGKTTGTGSDFAILDNTNPAAALPALAGVEVGNSVNAVLVGDLLQRPLAFVLTNSDLRIFDIHDTAAITSWATLALPTSGSTVEPSMDCEGSRLYIIANDASGRGALYVVRPS